MSEKKNSLTLKHKIGYGLGDCGGVMTFALMGSTFSMYCTDALGINPAKLALLLLIWNVWDFINDPIMGAFIDKAFAKSSHPKGKFRPWILRSAGRSMYRLSGELTKTAAYAAVRIEERGVDGRMVSETLPKWKLISSHTARRTAITVNVIRGKNVHDLRRCSGHSDLRVFDNYVRDDYT